MPRGTILILSSQVPLSRFDDALIGLLRVYSIPFVVANRTTPAEFDWLAPETWHIIFQVTPYEEGGAGPIRTVFMVPPPVPDCSRILNTFVDFVRRMYGVIRFVLLGSMTVAPRQEGGHLAAGTAAYLATLGARQMIQWAVLNATWVQGRSSFPVGEVCSR